MPARTATAKRDPESCPIHGAPDRAGCLHCDPIAARVSVILAAIEAAPEQRAVTPAEHRRYAELVLEYAAADHAHSVRATPEYRRTLKALKRAARWSAAAEAAR